MDIDKKDLSPAQVTEEAQAQAEAEAQNVPRDDQGRRLFDESGQPIHWATKSERVIALILALVVIAITIAMAYSIAVGDFFRW